MKRHDLQAQGDHDLRERLLAQHEVRRAIERLEREDPSRGARQHLLATATRLSRPMAPELHAVIVALARFFASGRRFLGIRRNGAPGAGFPALRQARGPEAPRA